MCDRSRPVGRRAALAGIAGGATVLSGGCLQRLRSVAGWRSPEQVRLRIETLPADADPYALELARTVAEWFRTAGLDAQVLPMSEQELSRQTLLRGAFDLFVTRLPAWVRDPDGLYPLLHSQYADAPGWQNPFGYADLEVDDLLEAQRRVAGGRRYDTLDQLQRRLARSQPFTVLGFADDVRAADRHRADWGAADLDTAQGYLSLPIADVAPSVGGAEGVGRRGDGRRGDDGEPTTLRLASTDHRATTNLNPLSVEFRRNGVLTGLLYDSLGREADGRLQPWLAERWEFPRTDPAVAEVHLREDAEWHDGVALTAEDVAFTYDLLADTSLGGTVPDGTETTTQASAPVPAPRFRGRSGLVETVTALDSATVEFRFGGVHPTVAVRAFTVPVLPAHVWRERTGPATFGGIDVGPVTDALVTNNIPPVGSGPLRFVRNTPRESLVLERFDGHFSVGALDLGGPAFDRLVVLIAGSDVSCVERVASGDADVTATPVGAETVPRIGRRAGLELLVERSATPYVLGYNVRRPHLNNPRFRNTLAGLVDGTHLVETVFDGYGHPAVGPLWDTRWYPAALEWDDGNPVTPFLGRRGDLDEERVREAFREAGYRYDDGRLVGGRT
ncbi:ABC transporter substrate-binding protein [Salinirubellus salinus]|uniref:ABC transporter substrate-binding protein n=1 Tax=Salinirubellus salinus TaxID=1364945 RepID=A0A9E7U9U3_9EURY|nr:ABC transporter substrate-binding protein [Salinirubellus salinus]UWM53523.1 ABC transporter substrate-binding protein [Salinirubellus salinus]